MPDTARHEMELLFVDLKRKTASWMARAGLEQ
jgi:hypothetical protein